MFSRLFNSDKGKKLGKKATFVQRVQAKLISYLRPFNEESPGLLDKLYMETHRDGEKRARKYLTSVLRLAASEEGPENKVELKILNDVYNKKSPLSDSKVLRRYLEAALFEHYHDKIIAEAGDVLTRTVDRVIEEAESQEVWLLYMRYLDIHYFPDGAMEQAKVRARVDLLKPCIMGESLKDAMVAKKANYDATIASFIEERPVAAPNSELPAPQR